MEKEQINICKRNLLVQKYDLLNFNNIDIPILVTVDEFFDGNFDEASIAPNLEYKSDIKYYYKILKNLSNETNINKILIQITDVLIYDDAKLGDNEWPFTDTIYVIGSISKEELLEKIIKLKPSEVDYADTNFIYKNLNEYSDKQVLYIWWD